MNCRFSSQCTLSFLPVIVKNTKELSLRGAVINLSSNASVLDTPLLTAYTACKAFNRSFSNTLAGECCILYNGSIDVLCLRPSFVESRMSGLVADSAKGRAMRVITAERFAKDSLAKLGEIVVVAVELCCCCYGIVAGYVIDVSPHWCQDVVAIFLTSIPTFLNKKLIYFLVNIRYQKSKAAEMEKDKKK